jgi:carbon-monoxide dehydrogenase small subunit
MEILTIEGLSREGGLTLVQEAFLEQGAVQCGFCTPGMVLATTALLEAMPQPSNEEIKTALAGHLCRCTGYNKIMEAVELAAAKKRAVAR